MTFNDMLFEAVNAAGPMVIWVAAIATLVATGPFLRFEDLRRRDFVGIPFMIGIGLIGTAAAVSFGEYNDQDRLPSFILIAASCALMASFQV